MATAREVAEQMRKKQQEQQQNSIDARSAAEMIKKYNTLPVGDVNDAYINAFYNDWNSFSSSAEKDYGSLGWGNASSSYDSRNTAWQELSARADTIGAWAYKNRSSFTNEGYASLTKDLNEIRNSASNILKSFQAEADYYSHFATEDEFNEWNKYSYIPESSDFAEKSKYVSTYRGGEKYNAFSNMYTDTGFDDIMYDYINRDENARQIKAVNDISNNSSFLGFDKSERREMSDDEISIFNYIYATQGKDAAYEYVDHITAGPVGLNARQREKETEAWASYAKESPVASSVFSVLEAPLKGLSYIGQAADYISDGKIDQNAGYNKFSYINSSIRNQVTQDIEKNWGGVGSFAYQTGMSMADFLFTTAVSGGNSALSLGIMGTGAAADTVIYAKDRGLSDTQAFTLGTIAGAAEIVTEKFSLDALLDATQLGKNALGYIAQNIITEGTEEVTSSAINLIADVLISRDKSEWQEAINAYKAVGMSDKEAFWHAVGDQALSLGLDFLGGAISGGVMGGGGVALNAVGNAVNTADQGSVFKGFGADLTREALEINPENRYAQKMQGKLDSGKNLSDYQLGKLVQQNENALFSQDKAKMKSAVEARLTELGETGDVAKLAEVITKAQTEGNLTRSERAEIESSIYGKRILNELDADNISSGEYTSEWTGDIGTYRINEGAYNRSTAEAEQAEAVFPTDGDPAKEGAPAVAVEAPAGAVNQTEATSVPEAEHIPESTKMVSESSEATADTTVSLEEASAKYGDQAQAMVRTYQDGQDVKQYDSAYQMAYDMGKSGVSLSYVMNSKSTEYLTKQQRELAYEAGQAAAGIMATAQHEKIKAAANGKTGRKKGTVKGEGVTIADLKKTFNDTQNRAYRILCTFAEATGVDIVLYKSETNENGDFVGAQGKFNRTDDKIYIDINAGLQNIKDADDLAKYAMLRTFSHEFTHFLEKYNAVWYNDFRKVVFETLTARGEDVNELIETKQAQNPGMDYDKASREVVAEAMTDILPDSQFIETLANKHKNIFTKLHDMLKEFLADLKAYFSSIGHNPSREANALKEQIGEAVRYVDNIVKMFDEGAAAAVDNYQMTVAIDENTGTITIEEKPVTNESIPDTEEITPDTHEDNPLGLTDEEQSAIMAYKSGGSYMLNAKLREGYELDEYEQQIVNGLDKALEKLPVYKGKVYRNIIFDGFGDQSALDDFISAHSIKEGVLYEAYTSTSTTTDGYPLEGDFVVHFEIESVTGRDLQGYGNNFENEVLFPRDSSFIVTGIQYDEKGTPTIYLTEETNEQTISRGRSEETLSVNHRGQQEESSESDPTQVQRLPEQKERDAEMQPVSERDSEGDTEKPERVQGVREEVSTSSGGLVIKPKETASKQGEPSIEEREKAFKRKFAFLKKAGQVSIFHHGNVSLLTDGALAIRATEDELNFAHIAYSGFITERITKGTPFEKLIDNANKQITEAPIQGVNSDGIGVYVFNVDGKQPIFDKKLLSKLDGNLLYIGDFAKGTYILKAVDLDGNVAGFLLSMKGKGEITDAEPSKLKSFSSKFLSQISKKESTGAKTAAPETTETTGGDTYDEIAQALYKTHPYEIGGFKFDIQYAAGSYHAHVIKVGAKSRLHTSDSIATYKEAVDYIVSFARKINLLKDSDTKASETPAVTPEKPQQVQEVKEDPKPSLEKAEEASKTPSEKLADSLLDGYINIKNLVSESGKALTSKELYALADEAFGGTQAEGKYDRKDAYDAMELAVNKFLLNYAAIKTRFNNLNGNATQAVSAVKRLEHLLELLPTQSVRTQEMEEFQQFSTPPNIAYLAAWSANISANDFVLEPSAGIGGLAVFAKAWGAEVAVNELSKRRLEVLRSMGFDHLFNENAEHIDNILPANISPSVVIMNPPFSSTAGRLKNNKTSNAEKHIDQALARLRDGGRLVAILGQGMNNADYYKYWDKLRKSFNIRANLSIDGSNYRKYGTTYGVQIVVIDKTGPQVGETVTGTFTDLTEIPKVLEGIRNDRSSLETNRTASTDDSIRESVSDERNEHADTGHQGVDERADGSSSGNERGKNRKGSDGNEGAGNRTDVKRPEKSGSKKTERKDGGTDRDSGRTDSGNGAGATESSVSDGHQPELPLPRLNETSEPEEVSDDGVYATFVSPEIPVKGGKKHPAVLVESAAMAAVSMPKATYKVHLPADVIANNLSEAQLVTVTYAGQAHEQMLPDKRRKGFFIGDGTGVGKGRQIAGIILDNFMQGRKKAVWISKNNDLFGDAVRDWTATTGRSKDEVFSHSKIKSGGNITNAEGILFSTYDTLKSEKGGNRLEQIVSWLGEDFDGVIAFDEAHAMGNLFGKKSKFGKSKGSLVAQAGVELQRRLPNARIVYVSATAATEVDNLAYAERIGLWGPGTAFNNAQDFISKIGSSGLAAMELVIRDMKAMGSYVARSISYNGVNYDTVEHALDPMQTEIYNTMSRAWQKTMANVQSALETTGGKYNSTARQKALGNFYSSMQRFYNQVLTSMSMPSVIADMKKELAAGHSCVLQIVNTNEAQQNKKLAEAKANGDSLDDLDLTPRESLIGYLMNSFPTQMYEEYTDDDGNIKSRPVMDSKGNPVQDKDAIRKRDALIEEVNQMSIPDGPLEMLFDVFGTEMVAENTGRSRRIVPKKQSDGSVSRVEERRTLNHRTADVQAFQDGKKRVLVFSDAGGTGKSYHADRTEKNQQLRIHYVLQPGWVASNAVQGFGRTHRSNEASAPIYKLVTTNIKGQKRFTSTIARRLDQLGALTKGQRDTGSGMFGAKDNLETDLAMDSLREFYRRLGKNQIEGIDGMKTLERLGLREKFSDEYGSFKLNENTARDIGTFLNRILALEVDEQNTIFDSFISIYEMELEAAIQSGTLDTGMENVKADKIEVVDDKVIRKDKNTGSETHYIQAKTYKKPKVVTDVETVSKMRSGFMGIYKTQNGAVRAVYRIADKTTEWGAVQKQFRLVGPNQGAKTSVWNEATLELKAKLLDKAEWQKEWDAEVAKVPEYNEDTMHMLTGALLPIWNSLPQDGNTKVKRLTTDKGDAYLGRVINKDMIDAVLGRFDIDRTKEVYSAKKVMENAIQKGVHFYLTNSRAEIFRSRVSNEWRLEITQPYNTWYLKRTYPELIQERISYRDRFFIPVGENGEAVLERILADNPVRNATDDDVQEQSRSYLSDKDSEYMNAVNSGDMETAQRMVNERAEELRAEVFAQTDVPTYRIRRGAKPKKTIKVYKVFTMSDTGKPSALFVSSQYDLPIGVWLDAQDTFHFTDQKNGHKYVPSTKNPNTKGGATGRPTNVVDISPEEVAELVKRGYLKKDKNGKLPKTITSLAYRPGWHAGDLPFFPQGGMQIEGSNYPNVHRYNQVVFECEMIADNDYTDYHVTEDGMVKLHDMQKMPDDGSYKYSTNPMTQSNDLGAWYIGSSIKIVRALTQEECDTILQESGRPVQEWQAYQDAGELKKAKTDARAQFADKKMRDEAAKLAEYEYEHRYGPLDLNALGYDPAQTDGGKKLLDAVTYDDDGNVIPISQRFNQEIDDVRYQQRNGTLTDREILEMAASAIEVTTLNDAEKDALAIFQKRLDKLKELQEKRVEQGRLYKEQQFGQKPDRKEAEETLNRMRILDAQIRKATADVLTVEEKEVLRRVLTKSRKVVEAKQREHDREMLNRWRDRKNNAAAIKKYRERIRGDVDELSCWILKPDNKNIVKHVPDVLKDSVISFLSSIDFKSQRLLKGKDATKADKTFMETLSKLGAAMKKNINVQGMYSGYTDLPPDFLDRLETFIQSTNALVNKNSGEFVINLMTSEELKELSQIVRTLKKYIIQLNRFHNNAMFQHVFEAGDDSVEALQAMSDASDKTGAISNFLFWQQMRPAFGMERFGKGGKSIYDELRRGQAKLAFNTKEIERFSKEAYTAKEVNAWEDEIKEFKIGEDIVKIPVSHIMSFYELSKDPEAREHINGEGIRVATYKRGGKKISDHGHILTFGEFNQIIDSLTDRQKEVADKLQKYMAEQGGKWGNHVSLARFGEELFTNKNYFPINSDGRHLSATTDEHPNSAALYALLNMSFTKSRKEGANNRIILYSIFDVFANHMASMAQYNAMALPVLDAVKWFNYQQVFIDETGKKTPVTTLRAQMDRVYGVPEETRPGSGKKGYATSFVENIIKAFNGTAAQGTPYDTIGLKSLRKFNMAQVAYNFRVAIQQPMAITRAGMLIDYKSIVKGMQLKPAAIKKNIEEMQKYSGIAAWKSLGFYDVNISRGLTHLIKHDDTFLERVGEVGMWGAEKLDTLTWAAMWSACKEEVIRKKQLTPSSEGFYKAVTQLFEEVIYKTQVVDSVLTKNEFMRDKGTFARLVGSFMSEATTNASMLLDAYDKYNLDIKRGMTKKQAWKKNGKKIGRTFYVYGVGAVLLAAVQAAADAWRDDDEYENYGEKYVEALIGNLVDELIPFNKLPIVADFYDLAKELASIFGADTYGNPPQTVLMQWFDKLVKGVEIIRDKIDGENTNYTWWGGIYNLLQAVSGMSGIAFASATREIVSAWNNIIVPMAPSLRIETYGATAEEDRNALYEAIIAGDTKEAARIEAKYKNQTDINTAIRKALRDNDPRIKEAAQAKFNGDIAGYTRITDAIFADGKFTENDIVAAINAEISAMSEKPESEPSDKEVSRYKIEDYYTSITNGDSASAYAVKYDLIETSIANGKDRDEAEASFNSSLTSHIREKYETGDITEYEAKNMLSYAGKTAEEAASKIQYWSFKKNYPDYDLSESAVGKYYSDVKPSGISLSVYYDYTEKAAKATGVDNNGDGKADSGTKKSEIMQIIHSLPISSYQKDVLYRLNGWAESTLYQAPWH